jgi:hypothetical protein
LEKKKGQTIKQFYYGLRELGNEAELDRMTTDDSYMIKDIYMCQHDTQMIKDILQLPAPT